MCETSLNVSYISSQDGDQMALGSQALSFGQLHTEVCSWGTEPEADRPCGDWAWPGGLHTHTQPQARTSGREGGKPGRPQGQCRSLGCRWAARPGWMKPFHSTPPRRGVWSLPSHTEASQPRQHSALFTQLGKQNKYILPRRPHNGAFSQHRIRNGPLALHPADRLLVPIAFAWPFLD